MPSEVQIVIRVSQQGVEAFEKTAQGLERVKSTARDTGVHLADVKAGFDILSRAVTESLTMIDQVNDLGVASLRAKASLDALSGGHAPQYLREMNAETRGLVPDMTLAQQAVKALTLHLVENERQAGALARAGAILGNTMGVGATQGVETLTLAMSRVGLVGLLDNIGLSGAEVKKRFHELQDTMGDQQAWSTAVLENAAERTKLLEGSLDGVGSAMDRLKAKAATAWQDFSGNVATSIEFIVRYTELLEKLRQEEAKRQGNKPAFGPGQSAISWLLSGGDENKRSGLDMLLGGTPPGAVNAQMEWDRTHPKASPFGAITGGGGDLGMTGLGVYGVPRPDYDPTRRNAPDYLTPNVEAINTSYEAAALTHRRQQGFELAVQTEGGLHRQGEREVSEIALAGEKQAFWNSLAIQGRAIYASFADPIKDTIDLMEKAAQAEAKADAERRQRNQSINAAFGVQGSGLGAEVGGGMEDAIAARRQQLVRRGAGKTELAAFDANAKASLDAYAISTGQATQESLKYRDIVAELNKEMTTGAISIQQGSIQLSQLALAAKNGSLSYEQLVHWQKQLSGELDHLQITRGAGDKEMMKATGTSKTGLRIAQLEGEFKTGTTTNAGDVNNDFSNPYAPMVKSAEKLTAATDKAAQASAGMVVSIGANSLLAANSMQPLYNKAVDVVRQVTNISKALYGLSGDLNVHIGFTVSGGGGPGGKGPV